MMKWTRSPKRKQMLALSQFFASIRFFLLVLGVGSPLKISLFITATNERLVEAVDKRSGDECRQTCSRWCDCGTGTTSVQIEVDEKSFAATFKYLRRFLGRCSAAFGDKTQDQQTRTSPCLPARHLPPSCGVTKRRAERQECHKFQFLRLFTTIVRPNLPPWRDRFVINFNSASQLCS